MNVTISKEELSKIVSVACSIVERKTTMPILANVLLSASDGKLKISATNLEITAIIQAKGEIASPGSTTVNARMFADIVRELPDTDVTLALSERERLEIFAGNSKFKMLGVSSEEFPSLPGVGISTTSRINAKEFLEMINKTLYAVSHDETRFNLNGVCFELDNQSKEERLRMIATDGHRLAMITRDIGGLNFEGGVIVPAKGLSEIRKILDFEEVSEVGVAITDGFFVLETEEAKISMRLIDGEFPDYHQVLPKKQGERVSFNSDDLAQSVKRAALMVTDKGKCVKCDFRPEKLQISSSSPELGESNEELTINYQGDPLSLGFNAKYLIDFSTSLSESQAVVLELNGELGPGKFYAEGDDSYIGIVMPMRLT